MLWAIKKKVFIRRRRGERRLIKAAASPLNAIKECAELITNYRRKLAESFCHLTTQTHSESPTAGITTHENLIAF